jgi:hypothetical protein
MVASANLDVGVQGQYVSQVDRSILLGNMMITPPVLNYVGHQMGISPSLIQATAPMTADVPRVVTDPGSGAAASDLVGSTDQYKLEVQADPTVPILHVYTQAPTTAGAIRLASAAVQGLIEYVASTLPAVGAPASSEPSGTSVGLEQLGGISGATANSGASAEIALLVFIGVFGISLWLILIGSQIRRGWTAARLAAAQS